MSFKSLFLKSQSKLIIRELFKIRFLMSYPICNVIVSQLGYMFHLYKFSTIHFYHCSDVVHVQTNVVLSFPCFYLKNFSLQRLCMFSVIRRGSFVVLSFLPSIRFP